MNLPRENLGYIVAVTRLVSKLNQIREKGDNKMVTDFLENSEYFKRLANDPAERQEVLQNVSKYMKYKFYPKGTVIHGESDANYTFSIILKGKALLYTPRTQEAVKKEYFDFKKSQVIREYIQYMTKHELEEKFKQWLNKKQLGTRALRKRMNMIPTRNDPNTFTTTNNNNNGTDLGDFSSVVNSMLAEKGSILPSHLRDFDITYQEKLLLLGHFGSMGKYIQDGVFTYQATKELQTAETFGEISLLKNGNVDCVIVAAEDVHLVSFTRDDYRLMYSSDIKNLKNKVEFLTKTFSDISKASVMKIAYFLEEKVMMSREVLYKEGEDPKAIYFVRKGEIQLSVQKTKATKVVLKSDVKSRSVERFNVKQKIVVGSMQPGSMFGEEDIIEKQPRKYTAVATHAQTFVYILRREVYTEVFEKHIPHIAAVFQDWMKVKSIWRNQRIDTEQELIHHEAETNYPHALDHKSSSVQDTQHKFYTPTKEAFTEHTDQGLGASDVQERIAFRVLPSKASLNPLSPKKSVYQATTSEYQLFERLQSDKIKTKKDPPRGARRIERSTPRRDTSGGKLMSMNSGPASLTDLLVPKSYESKVIKAKTLNNELSSVESVVPRKIKTLMNLDKDNSDLITVRQPINGTQTSKAKSYATVTDGFGLAAINACQRFSVESSKLSKESAKILHRIILKQPRESVDASEDEHWASTTENQCVNYHRKDKRLLTDSNRISLIKSDRTIEIEKKKESLGSSKQLKPDVNTSCSNEEKFRIKTGLQFQIPVKNCTGIKRANTVSIKNLEFAV